MVAINRKKTVLVLAKFHFFLGILFQESLLIWLFRIHIKQIEIDQDRFLVDALKNQTIPANINSFIFL